MNKVENVNISKLRKKRDAKIKLFSYDKRYYMDKDGMLYHIKNDKLVCQSFHRREKRIFVRLVTNSGNIKLFNFAFFIATLLLPNPLQSTRITFKDNNPLNCKPYNLRTMARYQIFF